MYFSSVGKCTKLLLKFCSWIFHRLPRLADSKRVSISLLGNPDSTAGPLIIQPNRILVRSFEHLPLVSDGAPGAYLVSIKVSKHGSWVLTYTVGRGWLKLDNLTLAWWVRKTCLFRCRGRSKRMTEWVCDTEEGKGGREETSRWRAKCRAESPQWSLWVNVLINPCKSSQVKNRENLLLLTEGTVLFEICSSTLRTTVSESLGFSPGSSFLSLL